MINETRRGVLKLFGISAAVAVPTSGVLATAKEVAPPALQNPMTLDLQPPAGFTYQWKRIFITAEEPDMDNIFEMIRAGWKPVPMRRHLDVLRPATANSDVNVFSYWIEHGGVVLMEKPTKDIPLPRPHPLPWECRDA